jgi:hypothetical protein
VRRVDPLAQLSPREQQVLQLPLLGRNYAPSRSRRTPPGSTRPTCWTSSAPESRLDLVCLLL